MPDDPSRIVRCAIHPAIGIARVGNAPAEFFLAPEAPGQAPDPGPSGFKTAKGQVKREGVRFRVYGYDAEGRVVQEITGSDTVKIRWQVHLANRKPAWYQFNNALDLKQFAMSSTYRNASITGAFRNELVNDPGAKEISGRSRSGPRYRFDQGYVNFGGGPIQVPLGELRTDEKGRLIVLGGHGKSASATGAQAVTFANNDGWYDDVSDGPVRARVKLADGRELEAEPAMVAVTPPNFGQGLYGVVTMYDVVYDLFLRQGWVKPEELTFWRDIYPMFERLVGNQWVSEGVFFLFGAGSPSDLTDPALLARLSSPDEEHRAEREALFRWFRQPPPPWDAPGKRAELPPPRHAGLPPFYGDGVDYANTTIYDLALTTTQYEQLKRWAAGDFVTGERPSLPPRKIEEMPLTEQPAALDRAALESCLGGPFHPGIELTWPMRVPSMWQKPDPLPFRLNILPPGATPQDDFGTILTPAIALGPEGPCAASGPGTLTRWMGVPWQTDEASCLDGYDTSTYLPLPSFWAARVPNEVLSMESYERLSDAALPELQRTKHLAYRQFWMRDLTKGAGSSYQGRINNMVKQWHLLGIIAEQPAPPPSETAGWPERYWAETERSKTFSAKDPTWRQTLRAERTVPQEEAEMAALESVRAEAVEVEEEPQHPVRRDER